MRKRKIGGILILFFMLMLVGCGEKTSSLLEKVDNYEEVTLKFEDHTGENILLEFEAIVINNINYVNIEDFICVCNKVNEVNKRIESLELEDWNEDERTLKVEYRADNVGMAVAINATRAVSGMNKGEIKVEGENKEVVYKLGEFELKAVLIEDEIYIPIDIINLKILGGDSYIIRTDKNKYALAKSYYMENQGKVLEGAYNEEYEVSIEMLGEYLKDNFQLEEDSKSNYEIDSYEDYMTKYNMMLNKLEDYHVNYSYKNRGENNKSLDSIKNTAFTSILFDDLLELGCDIEEERNILEFNKINDETMYLKINSFEGEIEEFFVDIAKFVTVYSNDDSIKTLVVDLRNNFGGFFYNTLLTMDKLVSDEYKLKIANLYNNEIFSTQEYISKRKKAQEEDKEFIVINNEASASASLLMTYLMKENLNAEVIGREPVYKKLTHVSYVQLIDGTLVSTSNPNYCFLTEDNVRLEDVTLVDKVMSDEEIEAYLKR